MLFVVMNVFLCLAAIAFPFSVAVTNVGLGVVLVLGVVSGQWWQGVKLCWRNYRDLTVVLMIYLCLVVLGLLWSSNLHWGLHIIGRHWFWLLIPVLMITLAQDKWRNYFMLALSTGLTVHLVYCVLQYMGYVTLTSVGGSGADNATGHIGHIGFGFVYGVWAAWLLFMGLRAQTRGWMFVCWGLAGWSYIMIFMARGRSGYVIAFVLAMAVFIKWYAERIGWKKMLLMIMLAFTLCVTVLALGPASERLEGTWLALTGDKQHVDSAWENNGRAALNERFQMWKTTLDVYQQHALVGVGTGGLPDAVAMLSDEDKTSSLPFVHPHNQYLLVLARWGPVGVLLLMLLFFYWMKQGWKADWSASIAPPLLFLPPLALAIHGLSSSAIEEHFSAVLAVMLLGVGLSERQLHINPSC